MFLGHALMREEAFQTIQALEAVKAIVWYVGKYAYSLSVGELDEKIDTNLTFVC